MNLDIRKIVDFTRFQNAKDEALEMIEKNIGYFGTTVPSGSARNGRYLKIDINKEWTTGFWTGLLSLSYEFSGDEVFREAFFKILPTFLDRLEDEERIKTHDLGFIYTLSFIPAMRVFGDESFKGKIVEAAEKLIRRFHEKPGYIQAWKDVDHPKERKRVIIDSMMNLPLLYTAWKISGDEKYRDIAVKHATTCMKHLVRENYSTYHTFLFDPDTGEPIGPETVQGHADDSYWARGQAWAVYGFTLSYIYTEKEEFLETAVKTADFMIDKLPDDLVPVWDMVFDVDSGEERDSSAATILASGLMELSKFVDEEKSAFYQMIAVQILSNLTESYFNKFHEAGEPIILHGVHAKPLNMGIDEGNTWGDYFYMEAFMKLLNKRWTPYWIYGVK